MSFFALDVAVGPIFVIIGFFLIITILLVASIIFFAVKAIKKIKRDVEE